LVHPGRAGEHAGTDVRDPRELEQPLDGPVLGVGAVHDGEHDVHPGDLLAGAVTIHEAQYAAVVDRHPEGDLRAVRVDLRHSPVDDAQVGHVFRAERPRPGLGDPDGNHLVGGAVEVTHDGAGGDAAHGVLGATTAVEDGNGDAVHRAEATRAS